MSSSVPYDPYIPGSDHAPGGGNQKTAAIQAVSIRVTVAIHTPTKSTQVQGY